MEHGTRSTLVRSALEGDGNAIEQLHHECTDPKGAKEIADLLLATLPQHTGEVEEWLHAIVELHPDMAQSVGAALKNKLGLRLDLEKEA